MFWEPWSIECWVERLDREEYFVAKIRSDRGDGGLSVELQKPSIRVKRALLSMLDDVKGKGWLPKPSSSDCAIEFSNKNNSNTNNKVSRLALAAKASRRF